MAVTGTGTADDPYIVDNWADFVAAARVGNAYIKFDDGGGVIDINEDAPNGIENTVINGAHIDGNGWAIKNIYNKNNSFSNGGSISNLHLLNVFSESGFFESTYLSDCKISGTFGGYILSSYESRSVDRCSFNISCFGTAAELTNTTHWASDRNIIFNHCLMDFSNTSSYQKLFKNTIFNNCLITGNTNQTYGCFHIVSTYNSIFDVEAPNMEMTLDNGSGICIANTEKAPNVSVSGNWQGVTTAQMSDAGALASIGFPIGVE